ncbi:hypothetical protein ACGFLT_25445 [Micromonospora chalcea]|uniref:hypothetical protein n=1 Tax=Micromonospora sp. B006 TaxID=2201999 RepID=UPI001863FD76|nr:hypothetical protein [Micromonospora sp. B006]
MTYLALVQADGWSLDRENLIRALQTDWPASVVDESVGRGDPALDVVWGHGAGEGRVEGSAHNSGQCIYLDGQERSVAEFVAWYRRLVPADHTVILCDDTYSFDAIVDPGLEAEQILALFPK